MSKTFEQGHAEIVRLCEYFATNRGAFCAPGVKEAHVRQDLIDPFFRALGWDVGNRDLSADELNRAVQLTIDRVVFLRMAEDRGLEPGPAKGIGHRRPRSPAKRRRRTAS